MINNKGPRRKLVRNTNKSLLSQKSMCSGRLLVHALLFAFPRLSQSLCRWLAHELFSADFLLLFYLDCAVAKRPYTIKLLMELRYSSICANGLVRPVCGLS